MKHQSFFVDSPVALLCTYIVSHDGKFFRASALYCMVPHFARPVPSIHLSPSVCPWQVGALWKWWEI